MGLATPGTIKRPGPQTSAILTCYYIPFLASVSRCLVLFYTIEGKAALTYLPFGIVIVAIGKPKILGLCTSSFGWCSICH